MQNFIFELRYNKSKILLNYTVHFIKLFIIYQKTIVNPKKMKNFEIKCGSQFTLKMCFNGFL